MMRATPKKGYIVFCCILILIGGAFFACAMGESSGRQSLTIRTLWEDGFDADGRPVQAYDIQLVAGGEVVATASVRETDGWTYTFQNLPASGERYTVERAALRGYTRYRVTAESPTELIVTNVFNDLDAARVDVARGIQVWKDYGPDDRPRFIEASLLTGTMEPLAYWDGTYAAEAVRESPDRPADGYEAIIISPFPEENPDILALETRRSIYDPIADRQILYDCWEWEITSIAVDSAGATSGASAEADLLPVYAFRIDSAENYTNQTTAYLPDVYDDVREGAAGEVFVRVHETLSQWAYAGMPPQTTSLSGTLAYDMKGFDGQEPSQAQIALHVSVGEGASALGTAQTRTQPFLSHMTQTAGQAGETGLWRWRFENLPMYYYDGTLCRYDVQDETIGFESVYDEATGAVVSEYKVMEVPVQLVWTDVASDAVAARPEAVEIMLLRNGVQADRATLTAATGWRHVFVQPAPAQVAFMAPVLHVEAKPTEAYADFCSVQMQDGGFTLWAVAEGETIATGRIAWDLGYFASLFSKEQKTNTGLYWPENTFTLAFAYVPEAVTVQLQRRVERAGLSGEEGWEDVPGAVQRISGPDWRWSFTQLSGRYGGDSVSYRARLTEPLAAFETTYDTDGMLNRLKRFSPVITMLWNGDGASQWRRGEQPLQVTVSSQPEGITALAAPALHDQAYEADSAVDAETLEYVYDLPIYTPEGTPIQYSFAAPRYLYYVPSAQGGRQVTLTPSESDDGQELDVYFENHPTDFVQALGGTIQWDASVPAAYLPEAVTLQLQRRTLPRGGEPGAWQDVPGQIRRVTGPDWRWSFEPLAGMLDAQTAYEYRYVDVSQPHAFISEALPSGDLRYMLAVVDVPVQVRWEDEASAQRQASSGVLVSLYAGDTLADSAVLTAARGWAHTFAAMPQYDPETDERIEYRIVQEETLPGFMPAELSRDADGTLVADNRLRRITLEGVVEWAVQGHTAHIPSEVTLGLQRRVGKSSWEDVPQASLTLRRAEQAEQTLWQWTFEPVPQTNAAGKDYEYRVEQRSQVPGFFVQREGELKITNWLQTRQLTVRAVWDDGMAGGGPARALEILLHGGEAPVPVLLSAQEGWEKTVDTLPLYRAGTQDEIEYTASRDALQGYEAAEITYEGDTVIVTSRLRRETVSGEIEWEVFGHEDHIPGQVTVRLERRADADGQDDWESAPGTDGLQVVTDADGWRWAFEDLPVLREAGGSYAYRAVLDAQALPDFDIQYGDGQARCTLRTADIRASVAWDDDFTDETRPARALSLTLYAQGKAVDTAQATAQGGWAHTFARAPLYQAGSDTPMDYTVGAAQPFGYEASEPAPVGDGAAELAARMERMDLAVEIRWEDKGYPQRIPAYVDVQLQRRVVGEQTWENVADGMRRMQAEGDETVWRHVFEGLAKTDGDAQVYDYRIDERTPLPDFTISYTSDDAIVCTLMTTSVPVRIVWIDGLNDAQRPLRETEVALYDGEERIATATVRVQDGWAHTFANVPLHHAQTDTPVKYTARQAQVPGYDRGETAEENGVLTLTNALRTISVEGEIAWETYGHDGYMPERVEVALQRRVQREGQDPDDGWEALQGDAYVQTADAAGGWRWRYEDLPEAGDDAVYEYRARLHAPVPGFETAYPQAGGIQNTLLTTSMTVNVYWDDGLAVESRPEGAVELTLLRGDVPVASEQVDESMRWTCTFVNLPLTEPGRSTPATYRAQMDRIAGYDEPELILAREDSVALMNRLSTLNLTARVQWEDGFAEESRPTQSLFVTLMQDEKAVRVQALGTENGWQYTFEGLERYWPGTDTAIAYSVKAASLPGYAPVEVEVEEDGVVCVRHTLLRTSLRGEVVWQAGEWTDAIPSRATIRLQRREVVQGQGPEDGWEQIEDASGRRVIERISEQSKRKDWTWSFEDLPASNGGGVAYEYRAVLEDAPEDFEITYADGRIEATLATVRFDVRVVWEDDYTDATRPTDAVELEVYADAGETPVRTLRLTAADGWQGTVDGLPQYLWGTRTAIDYTLRAPEILRYEKSEMQTSEDGTVTVTNRLQRESLRGEIRWEAGAQEGYVPASVSVALQWRAAGAGEDAWRDVPGRTQSVSGPDWAWSFEDIPAVAEDGQPYAYRVRLTDTLRGMEILTMPDGTLLGRMITRPLYIQARWEDAGFTDMRPAGGIPVVLRASTGEAYHGLLTAALDWTMTYPALPVQDAQGNTISYAIEGDAPQGYRLQEIIQPRVWDGRWEAVLVNVLDSAGVSVNLLWRGVDQTGTLRARAQLLQDGQAVASHWLSAENGWQHTFANAPRYDKQGNAVRYTVRVQAPSGFHTIMEVGHDAQGSEVYTFVSRMVAKAGAGDVQIIQAEGIPIGGGTRETGLVFGDAWTSLPGGRVIPPPPDRLNSDVQDIWTIYAR